MRSSLIVFTMLSLVALGNPVHNGADPVVDLTKIEAAQKPVVETPAPKVVDEDAARHARIIKNLNDCVRRPGQQPAIPSFDDIVALKTK